MSSRHLLLVPAVCALAACPPRVDFGKDGEAKSPDELLRRIAVAETQVIGLKGDSKLTVEAPQGKGSTSAFIAVLHPAFLHVEQLDFFGRPQGVLVTDGTSFGLLDSQAGKYFRGPASPANLGRFLPVVLPPQELAAILLGRVPRIATTASQMGLDEKKGVYTLVLRRGEVTQRLEVDPKSGRVVHSTVEGMTAYELEFGDLSAYGPLTFPRELVLKVPAASTTLELRWREVTLNDATDLTLYDQAPPENVPVVELDARGAEVAPEPPPSPDAK